jgi:hypothetical protein
LANPKKSNKTIPSKLLDLSKFDGMHAAGIFGRGRRLPECHHQRTARL